jgi:hypothetical protein
MSTTSYVTVPPDSTGKKLATRQHVIDTHSVQAQVVHLADPASPDNIQAIDNRGAAAVRFSEGQPILSGFGSLKNTQQRALGVYEASLDTYDALFTVEEVTGGVNTYDAIGSSNSLSVTGSVGSRVTRTTNRYHYYNPGTSNLINQTIACGDTGKTGNARRWGAYDNNDGLYFELDGAELGVVIRSSTTGSVVHNRVARQDWNGDKLDGTGRSGHNIDLTKINLYWIDYQWLGAGRVRFGIYEPSGARLVCHSYSNAGAFNLPYMRTGTLPLRTENINTGTTGAASELREVCMAAYTEGDFKDYAFWRAADMDVVDVTVTTNTHLLSVKSKSTINGKHNSVQTYPETLNVYADEPVAITIWQTTTVTGGAWSLTSDSSIDGTIDGSLSTSGARKFKVIYVNAGAVSINMSEYFEVNDEGVMCSANGTPEVWSITATRLRPNVTKVSLNLSYRELW